MAGQWKVSYYDNGFGWCYKKGSTTIDKDDSQGVVKALDSYCDLISQMQDTIDALKNRQESGWRPYKDQKPYGGVNDTYLVYWCCDGIDGIDIWYARNGNFLPGLRSACITHWAFLKAKPLEASHA